MKKTISVFYSVTKWLILLLILLSALVMFILESPATVLNLLRTPLQEQNITYSTMEGGLLSGFTLKDINYKNQVKAKTVALKVDFEALRSRVLRIDNLVLENAQIDRDFLTALIDNNSSSEETSSKKKLSLPFDKVLVKKADVSIEDTGYKNYYISSAKLHVDNLETDMKNKHKGAVTFVLDSNISKANIEASLVNKEYDVVATIEGNRAFVNTLLTEYNLSLLLNPKLQVTAKGDLESVDYDINIDTFSLKQNDYLVYSKALKTFGSFNIKENVLKNRLKTELDGNVAHLKLDAKTDLDFDDLNNTLHFDLDAHLKPKESFVATTLSEQNITINALPKILLIAKGGMNALTFNTRIEGLKVKRNGMALNLKDLKLKGDAKPFQGDIQTTLWSTLDSSLVDGTIDLTSFVNYKDVNNSLVFNLETDVNTHGAYLSKFLKENNLTLIEKSNIKLKAKGDMNRLTFNTNIIGLKAKYKDINLNLKALALKGKAKPLQGDVNIDLSTNFNSSILDGKANVNSFVNYKDVNNSLTLDMKADLLTHGTFLSKYLKESNITVNGESTINILAKGDMQKIHFSTNIKNFRAKQNAIKIDVKSIALNGDSRLLQGDTTMKLLSVFSSTVADGTLDASTKLNFKDVNNTFEIDAISGLKIHSSYVNNFLKESNISLRGESDLSLKVSGNLKKVLAKVDFSSQLFTQNILSKLTLKSNDMQVNLAKHSIDGAFNLASDAKRINLTMKSRFNGDYLKPKTINTQTTLDVNNFFAFGVNLNALTPLKLNLNNSLKGVGIALNSKMIQLNAKSKDYDTLDFDIKTGKIYPNKIVALPEELKGKFVQLDLAGSATISQYYFRLNGYLASNKNFKALIDAKNAQSGLDVTLETEHLKATATGDIKTKNIEAKVSIDSVRKVEEEFANLYSFPIIEVDGAVDIKAKLKGEKVTASVESKKIAFQEFNIENINIHAVYSNDLLTLNRLDLTTTGFKDKKLNKKFYLNQKGRIYLGERRDVSLDIHPKIKVNLKGTKENLNGTVSIDALPLGYPEYGEAVLTTDINYAQFGKKKKITGTIVLDKMKVGYEAKFLDPANDSDVIIITKKDKNKKKDNSFLEDTYIDLAIRSKNAQYKTKDIDLTFMVNIRAKKEFGKNLGMLGKIYEINGLVEQAPKFFSIIDSSIVFRGTKEINPLLDISVEYELPDVLIKINIYGDAHHPQLQFSSEPEMPKKDILSYLVLGVSTASLSEGEADLGREAELFIMNQAARDLAYELDLDRVFIKDDGTGEGYAIQVGKKIDKKSMFVVESSKEGNSFILEYDVSKNIKVELGQHQKTVPSQSIDIFFRKKFK